VEEIIAVMQVAGDGPHGARVHAPIVIMWRARLRINEALYPQFLRAALLFEA